MCKEVMKERKSEKIGWIGGWLGGFLWVCLLSIMWFVQGKIINGIMGLVLFSIAVFFITVMTPWKYPETKYWKLMLPLYVVLIVSASLFLFEGELDKMGLTWWSILWLIPIFIPFATMGSRRWNDGNA